MVKQEVIDQATTSAGHKINYEIRREGFEAGILERWP
jgi:hypothetical protein